MNETTAKRVIKRQFNIIIDEEKKLKSIKPFPARKVRPCVFEYIYFPKFSWAYHDKIKLNI